LLKAENLWPNKTTLLTTEVVNPQSHSPWLMTSH
jgi:hypothetical protein